MGKTEIYLIRCKSVLVAHLQTHNLVVSNFPCKYLGFPLHHKKPSKEMMQHVFQMTADFLVGKEDFSPILIENCWYNLSCPQCQHFS
jgi:hypothetical protein